MKVCCGGYATIPSQRRRVANAPRSCVMGDACSCGERYAFIPAFFAFFVADIGANRSVTLRE
jgi:hypothetical protein